MTPDFISWWDTFGKFHYQEAEIRTPIDAARLGWEAASQSAPSDTDTLREERDTAVAHANGLTDLIRRMDTGYVRGLEDAALAIEPPYVNELRMVSIEWAQRRIRALKAAHTAQINAAPQGKQIDDAPHPAVAAPIAAPSGERTNRKPDANDQGPAESATPSARCVVVPSDEYEALRQLQFYVRRYMREGDQKNMVIHFLKEIEECDKRNPAAPAAQPNMEISE